ncbi:hypothetical protein GGS23DRAFT_576131 [Durotheca rogersii]|uniref:uncharacterized protein n=1 Tax=Durotheca rogersii TaxID=419775 RepID=UPI00222121EC|nr:uncharacterized protein GGS23DRAFT_576131 [Durotheca rogersii]KAI5861296.1 hypothetical protein GGS23DRAFT_576131 [Durotheca rogersii]
MLPSAQLRALLAMPASLRTCLASAHLREIPSRICFFSTSPRRYIKPPNIAGFLVPESEASFPVEISPDELFKTSYVTSAPGKPLPEELTTLFMRNEPKFLYAQGDFYKLKKNTRIPEICVLGRSNVGKSTFINALAGRSKSALAFISNTAGRTRSMNAYGFGPAPTMKEIAAESYLYKGKEDIPTHSCYVIDLPGYGFASSQDWGRNITLFLTKRVGLKAIVLIDAAVGPKDTDFQILEFLCSVGVRTAIVLSKADKAKGGIEDLRATCSILWQGIRAAENKLPSSGWSWEREIFVTALGARDSDIVSTGTAVVRLVVARLAGLVTDNRPKAETNRGWSGKVVSFEDLQYISSPGKASTPKDTTPTLASPQVGAVVTSDTSPKDSVAALERASAETSPRTVHMITPRAWSDLKRRSSTGFFHSKAFHSSAISLDEVSTKVAPEPEPEPEPAPEPNPDSVRLREAFDEFIKGLNRSQTAQTFLEERRRLRDRQPPRPLWQRNILQRAQRREAQLLERQFPEQTKQIEAVLRERARITEQEAQQRGRRGSAAARAGGGARPQAGPREQQQPQRAREPDAGGDDEPVTADMLADIMRTPTPARRLSKKERKKEKKKSQKEKQDAAKARTDEMDEFEAKFARAIRK